MRWVDLSIKISNHRVPVISGFLICATVLLLTLNYIFAAQQAAASVQQPNNFGAVHFPLLLPNALMPVSDGLDNRFTDMLVELGVGYVVFEEDPWILHSSPQAEARLASAIAYARSQGLKIHLINQEIVGYYDRLNVSLPQGSSYQEFHDLMVSMNVYLASTFKPDRLTVLAEPQHYQIDIGSSFTVGQWVSVAVDSGRAVKSVNSSIQTWVDNLSTSSFDYSFAQQIRSRSGINGVGYDLYHNDTFNSVVISAALDKLAGKKVGFTEVWPTGDLYAHSELDNASYAEAESKSINSTYAEAKRNGLTGVYNPFFTQRLLFLDPLPLPFQVDSTATYLSRLDSALMQGNRTVIFNSYRALILEMSG